ncbi:hypothetical protein CB0940_04533 [Cercospora beticola]|uniref:Uncharacterized protein n=1 Tax=Cercospora beticola TaxID=122368 RepID=A0A2G5HMW5_CERBT|nr:hypothetical protein CB0940_04533 [Cercospora beticola]PIA93891.1 hypothetical protein CB0940_04533 [Cercospora beticola]WPB01782.1 hypothetical protein RHO25_006414 [Cercospora beticola]
MRNTFARTSYSRPTYVPNNTDPWLVGIYNKSLLRFESGRCRGHRHLKLDSAYALYDDWMSLDVGLVKKCLSQKVRLQGGFRNMLLSQPPPTSASILVEFKYPAGNMQRWWHHVHRVDGVRLRDIVDAFREKMQKWQKTKAQDIHTISLRVKSGESTIFFPTEDRKRIRNMDSMHGEVRERGRLV